MSAYQIPTAADDASPTRFHGPTYGPPRTPSGFNWRMLALYAALSIGAGLIAFFSAAYFPQTSLVMRAAVIGAVLGTVRGVAVFIANRRNR